MKKRDFSIDMLKTLAVILIVNSHAAVLYPESIKALATGGGIGNSLFFYCSGFLLFGSTANISFFNWYKKRINRIFPIVFCAAIITSVFFTSTFNISVANIFFLDGAWFVRCIMIYYAIYYFIDRYFSEYFIHIAILVFILAWVWFFVADTATLGVNNPQSKITWLWYFVTFLAGTYSHKIANFPKLKLWLSGVIFILCVGLYCFFHGVYLTKLHNFQLFLVPFLAATPIFAHIIVSNSGKIQAFLEKYPTPFKIVSTLTLNIYLLHSLLFKFCEEIAFPLNIVVMGIVTLVLAYLLQVFVNFFIQTMQKGTYDWEAMIKVW